MNQAFSAPSVLCLLLLAGGLTAAVGGVTLAGGDVRVRTLGQVEGGTGGVVVDSRGNVYSADFGAILGNPQTAGTKIYRFAPDGTPSVFASGFEGASGIAIDSKGIVYQSNVRGGYVSRVTPDGAVSTFASEGLQAPVGIVIDAADTLWVANCGSASIQKVSGDGASTRFAASPLLKCPNGITLDDEHNLYAANFYNGDVVRITPDGEVSVLATLPGNNNGHIVFSNGSLFVVARAAHQIYEVSLAGEMKLFAGTGEKGGRDGAALEASFCFPNDIAVSADGKTFYVNEVADEATKGMKLAPTRLRVIDLTDTR